MNEITEIRLTDKNDNPAGIGSVWEARPGKFSWSHPDGSQGSECSSFEEAVKELEAVTDGE